jgi:hypothetical protein
MTYTINGKEWTENEINKRCAELLGVHVAVKGTVHDMYLDKEQDDEYNPCQNPLDTDAIIDMCWGELMEVLYVSRETNRQWDFLIKKHTCTKLVAACICYIEINEAAL